jgi:hypothetical protein
MGAAYDGVIEHLRSAGISISTAEAERIAQRILQIAADCGYDVDQMMQIAADISAKRA